MARALLRWTLTDLAEAAKVGRATAARFELGEAVNASSVAAMRAAFEKHRVRFVDSGKLAGAVFRMTAA